MPHVELASLSKTFGGVTALKDINLSIEKGEFCALLGPSGCGKSTLLRLIAGLEDVTTGEIRINGRDVTDLEPSDRRIAMVFQSYALYPHMTVAENIAFSLEAAGEKKAQRLAKATAVAKTLKIDQLLDRRPAMLSGGQRQRVAIGRALVRDPEVFLFDEPLSNLDAMLRVQMRIELSSLHHDLAATMIYVTHDQVEAMTMADRIVVMDQGQIQQIGAPLELYNNPANKFVATFIGSPSMNILPARTITVSQEALTVGLDKGQFTFTRRGSSDLRPDQPVELGIRPEHAHLIDPASADAVLPCKVRLVESLGNQTIVHLETALGAFVLQGSGDLIVKSGDTAALAFDPPRARAFDSDGRVL